MNCPICEGPVMAMNHVRQSVFRCNCCGEYWTKRELKKDEEEDEEANQQRNTKDDQPKPGVFL